MNSDLTQFHIHCLSLKIAGSFLKLSKFITNSEIKALQMIEVNLDLILTANYVSRDLLTSSLEEINLADLYIDPLDKEGILIYKARVDSLDLYNNSYSKHIKEIKTYASILKSP